MARYVVTGVKDLSEEAGNDVLLKLSLKLCGCIHTVGSELLELVTESDAGDCDCGSDVDVGGSGMAA